jgi:hypothetical protein
MNWRRIKMDTLDLADYKTILNHQGKVSGYMRYLETESIIDEIFIPFKDGISLAKGVLLEFDIKKGSSRFTYNICMETFYNMLNEEAEFISCINEVDDIDEGFVFCRIILTGL